MRILIISSELPPDTGFGGIGTYVATLAPALSARGHDVTVLSRSATSRNSDELTADGVRVIRLPTREAPVGFWRPPFTPEAAAMAKEHYDRAYTVACAVEEIPGLADVDVIEAPDWAGEAALLRLVTDRPFVVRFHTPSRLVFSWNEGALPRAFVDAMHNLERTAVENAMGYSCPSEWMVPEVERVFGMPRNSVVTIPNPYQPGSPPVASAERQHVLYLGRLEARKGVLDVVPAMTRVMTSLPSLRWRLAGADSTTGPRGSSVRAELLERLPESLHSRVDLLGAVDPVAVRQELVSAAAVLLPSRYENFPYTCLEAMDARAAVVASRRGGMAEMIDADRTGLLVDPADSDEVADALFRVLTQPFFAAQLGDAARAGIAGRYEPQTIAADLEAHWRKVMAAAAEIAA